MSGLDKEKALICFVERFNLDKQRAMDVARQLLVRRESERPEVEQLVEFALELVGAEGKLSDGTAARMYRRGDVYVAIDFIEAVTGYTQP